MPPSDLDDLYGVAIEPQGGVRDWERYGGNIIRRKLDDSTANYLKEMIESARTNSLIQPILQAATVLWAVGADGEIYLAVEEIIVTAGVPMQRPRLRGVPLTLQNKALGHPMLVEGRAARIAGELYLDIQGNDLVWVIDNRSGRYGRHVSRKEQHLVNVAARFAEYGLNVTTDFQNTN